MRAQASMLVMTLITPQGVLSENFLAVADDVLRRDGGDAPQTNWLAPAEAVDVVFDGMVAAEAEDCVRKAFGDAPVDVIVQSMATRRKRFLLADMESTIIPQEMLEEMADAIDARAHVTEITRRAMNGEIDFAAALRERMALFRGQSARLLKEVAARITLMPGAAQLVGTMRAHGAPCWLATSGFRCFIADLLRLVAFDRTFGNEMIVRDGVITGDLAEPILDRASKLEIFRLGLKELGLTAEQGVTVGDGANDLPMLTACSEGGGLGIAYHAKPNVTKAARYRIDHGDLTAILFAQGYKRAEFVG